jgi:hypothetical protein
MLCENCKQQEATVHITETAGVKLGQVKRHFCTSCAKTFQATDLVHRTLSGVPMVKLRVTQSSSHRTSLNVFGGRYDGESWSFITERLLQLRIEPFQGQEFEIQDEENYIDWLKGNRSSLYEKPKS